MSSLLRLRLLARALRSSVDLQRLRLAVDHLVAGLHVGPWLKLRRRRRLTVQRYGRRVGDLELQQILVLRADLQLITACLHDGAARGLLLRPGLVLLVLAARLLVLGALGLERLLLLL